MVIYMWQRIKNYYHFAQAIIATIYFGFPSKKLTVIGITGTDGKTTTVSMLYHILKSNGKNVSSISSINAFIGGQTYDTGFHVTTPSPWHIQKYLKVAADKKSKYLILEATSHGLDQNRLAFVKFKVAAITNIAHEHLDYHKDKISYLKSKARLFKNVDYSVLNKDDLGFNSLKKEATGNILTYSLKKEADFNLKKYPIKLEILGSYNLRNALAACACATVIGISKQKILKALSTYKGIPGRLQKVDLGQSFTLYIDFAHTPQALEEVLTALKPKTDSTSTKVIAVFGAAGERDKLKRPMMGKIAARLADVSILTAEDPRSENVDDICQEIAKGFKKMNKKQDKDYYIIVDRKKAIEFAINLAQKNYVVGLFGKGHEKSMTYGKKDTPWDEFKTAENTVRDKLKLSLNENQN